MYRNYVKLCKLLCQKGATVSNIKNSRGQTAVELASRSETIALMKEVALEEFEREKAAKIILDLEEIRAAVAEIATEPVTKLAIAGKLVPLPAIDKDKQATISGGANSTVTADEGSGAVAPSDTIPGIGVGAAATTTSTVDTSSSSSSSSLPSIWTSPVKSMAGKVLGTLSGHSNKDNNSSSTRNHATSITTDTTAVKPETGSPATAAVNSAEHVTSNSSQRPASSGATGATPSTANNNDDAFATIGASVKAPQQQQQKELTQEETLKSVIAKVEFPLETFSQYFYHVSTLVTYCRLDCCVLLLCMCPALYSPTTYHTTFQFI